MTTSRPRRSAYCRSSASWLPVPCSSVLTRTQMAHLSGMRISLDAGGGTFVYNAQVSGHDSIACWLANMG